MCSCFDHLTIDVMSLIVNKGVKFVRNGHFPSKTWLGNTSLHNISLIVTMPRRAAKKEMSKIDEKKMKLIQLVRENEILYDLSHVDHKNAQMKLVIWEKIALILGETGKYFLLIKFYKQKHGLEGIIFHKQNINIQYIRSGIHGGQT